MPIRFTSPSLGGHRQVVLGASEWELGVSYRRLTADDWFVEELGIRFPVLLDARGKVRQRYGLVSVPTTVFVDAAGLVRSLHPGPLTRTALNHGLEAILPPP